MSLTDRALAEQLAMLAAADELAAERTAEARKAAEELARYGVTNAADLPPDVLEEKSWKPVLTGDKASPLADTPISTGDPVVDAWEREELEGDEPIRFIDGPAPAAASSPAARKLASYSRAR